MKFLVPNYSCLQFRGLPPTDPRSVCPQLNLLNPPRKKKSWVRQCGRVTVHGCTVRSPLTGCQVTSRSRDRFSRYSKWLNTSRTALVLTLQTSKSGGYDRGDAYASFLPPVFRRVWKTAKSDY